MQPHASVTPPNRAGRDNQSSKASSQEDSAPQVAPRQSERRLKSVPSAVELDPELERLIESATD